MKRINIHDAKAHLSEHLKRVEKGERILICRRNVPIAEIRPVRAVSSRPRPFGLAKGAFAVPASFFEPLPEDVVSAFEGRE